MTCTPLLGPIKEITGKAHGNINCGHAFFQFTPPRNHKTPIVIQTRHTPVILNTYQVKDGVDNILVRSLLYFDQAN